MSDTGPASRPSVVTHTAPGGMHVQPWLRRALTEAALVVFAVLFALAVDAWWEDRENAALAGRAQAAIASEIRRNRDQLANSADAAAYPAALDSAIAQYRDGREPASVSVTWDMMLLSSAAWETAQLNRLTPYMDLDDVIELAEVYELQRFFTRNQDELASLIADIGARIENDPVVALTQLRSRFALTLALQTTLQTVYACTLALLEGPDAPGSEDCPDEGADAGAQR